MKRNSRRLLGFEVFFKVIEFMLNENQVRFDAIVHEIVKSLNLFVFLFIESWPQERE